MKTEFVALSPYSLAALLMIGALLTGTLFTGISSHPGLVGLGFESWLWRRVADAEGRRDNNLNISDPKPAREQGGAPG